MGSGRGKKSEKAAEQRAIVAYNDYTPDPLETARKNRTMKFLNEFESGKDVKDIGALSPYLDLYNNARNSQANQRIGSGVAALGKNPNSDSQVSDLDKFVQAQREQDAAGMLYNASNQAYQDAVGEGQYLIGVDQTRKANRAGLANQMYHTQLNRPRQKPLWERLWGMVIQTGQAAGSAMTGMGAMGA